jgi:hypothetical protein
VASIRTSSAVLQSPAWAGCARAISGTPTGTGTRAAVEVIRTSCRRKPSNATRIALGAVPGEALEALAKEPRCVMGDLHTGAFLRTVQEPQVTAAICLPTPLISDSKLGSNRTKQPLGHPSGRLFFSNKTGALSPQSSRGGWPRGADGAVEKIYSYARRPERFLSCGNSRIRAFPLLLSAIDGG